LTQARKKLRTETIPNTLSPVWGEEFTYRVTNSALPLLVECFDEDAVGQDEFIGSVELELDRVAENPGTEQNVVVEIHNEQGESGGMVWLTLTRRAVPPWRLVASALRAKGLPIMDSVQGLSDPYLVITVERKVVRTKTVFNSQEPMWAEKPNFRCTQKAGVLEMHCFDERQITSDVLIGSGELNLAPVCTAPGQPLQFDVALSNEHGDDVGTVHMTLQNTGDLTFS